MFNYEDTKAQHKRSSFSSCRCAVAVQGLRQHREHPGRELAEVGDVDRAVVVVIEVREKAGLAACAAAIRLKGRQSLFDTGKTSRGKSLSPVRIRRLAGSPARVKSAD